MGGKVTLYVRDEELWTRARQASRARGLSHLVQQCLRRWLDEGRVSAPAPSLVERARRLRENADALVRVLEDERQPPGASRTRRSRP